MNEVGLTTKQPTAAVYSRVSTNGQDAEAAMADLLQAARQRGYAVPRSLAIAETGSGARNDRPGLQRVLEAARKGQAGAVLVTRLDRFGRSSLDLQTNVRALVDAGVRFVCTEQGLEIKPGGDAVSQLLLTMLAGVAEFERSIIRERVIEGQRRARAEGRHIGRPFADTAPEPAAVAALRKVGKSWSQVAAALACSPGQARRAVLAGGSR